MADEVHHVDEILNKLADAKKNVDKQLDKLWNKFHEKAEEIRISLQLLEHQETATPTNAQSALSLVNKEIARLNKYSRLQSREEFALLVNLALEFAKQLIDFKPVLENFNPETGMQLCNKLDVLVATVETNYLQAIQELKKEELELVKK